MPLTPSALLELSRSPEGKKMLRYSATSVICVIISTIVLTILGLLKWDAFWAALTATAIATVPSYELNRKWAWGKSGKGHLWKEVVPFWTLALIGLVFSTWAAVGAQAVAQHHHFVKGDLRYLVLVDGAFIGAFGVLWIGKFIIFNKILFVHHPEDLTPALDGRTGLPG